MIDEYWTWRCYGYHSDELSAQSARRVIAVCECCGKYRDIRMNSYRDLCRSCVLRGRTHTDASNQKRSETMKAYTRAKNWWINAYRTEYKCRVCGSILVIGANVTKSRINDSQYICTDCCNKRSHLWRKANLEKVRKSSRNSANRSRRKQGILPYDKNRRCALFLGVHVAEQVLSHAFKDVERMPIHNHGYDFICNHGKKIDVKSSCILSHVVHGIKYQNWIFCINHNTIADYFLLLAFDNREDLNPLHVWLIPGNRLNHLITTTISPSTIHKWDEYKLPIDRVVSCCEAMR